MPRLTYWPALGLAVMLMLTANAGVRAQQSTQDLAEAAQNPVAAMYSLPFQNNIYGGVGPAHNATGNVLNIQPVIPITVGEWNIISRTIAPLIYQPSLATLASETFELGPFASSHFHINQSFYFSPANAAGLIWGIDPSFNLPTATPLGSAKFSMGPAAVALVIPKPWVIGTLARQLWSVAGPSNRPDLSQLLQPFINYNMPEGWYPVSSPIITANWEAQVGFSNRRRYRQDFQDRRTAMNASLQAFDYVLSPTGGPRWAVRAQL